MLKDDGLVGAIIIYRQEVRPFTAKQIDLTWTGKARGVVGTRPLETGPRCHSLFDLVYPQQEKRSWDAVVTRISLSLRPLEG